MKRTAVKSSNLRSVGYDRATKVLEVQFHSGAIWQYHGVPPAVHRALLAAESVGGYFAASVKGRYSEAKVTTREAE